MVFYVVLCYIVCFLGGFAFFCDIDHRWKIVDGSFVSFVGVKAFLLDVNIFNLSYDVSIDLD